MKAHTLTSPIFIISLHPWTFKGNVILRVFLIITVISIAFLFLVYIFQVNLLTKEIYFIKNYEKKLKLLTQENENLEINFSQTNSLSNIESYLDGEGFEKVTKVKYIQIYRPVAEKPQQ